MLEFLVVFLTTFFKANCHFMDSLKNATKLLESYVSDRKKQIKLGDVVSSWAEIKKGITQGSI